MALLNYKKKEINAKIVYYGPGLSGKTTNIQFIHTKLRPDHKGKLMTLATQTDRTLFFDFLPVELGEIRGLKTRFQLYTVPGQVFYNATRKLVLKGVDGVVFVADSNPANLADNIESLKNLEQNLAFHGHDIRAIPLVIQYNKRDLANAMPIAELEERLNVYGAAYTEASAGIGKGVLETLTRVSKLVLQTLRTSHNVTRVGDDAPDGNLPDPAIVPAEANHPDPLQGSVLAEPLPAEAPAASLEVQEELVLADPEGSADADAFEESQATEEELEIEIEEPVEEESFEIEESVEEESFQIDDLPPPAPEASEPAALRFQRIVSVKQTGDAAIDMTLAFENGDKAINLTLTIDVKAVLQKPEQDLF
jgi:mutual gliding-motility protein MglA